MALATAEVLTQPVGSLEPMYDGVSAADFSEVFWQTYSDVLPDNGPALILQTGVDHTGSAVDICLPHERVITVTFGLGRRGFGDFEWGLTDATAENGRQAFLLDALLRCAKQRRFDRQGRPGVLTATDPEELLGRLKALSALDVVADAATDFREKQVRKEQEIASFKASGVGNYAQHYYDKLLNQKKEELANIGFNSFGTTI